jgi:hypothetical protein
MWQPILDYFDAFFIGIADTLTRGIRGFFNQNVVYTASNINEDIPEEIDVSSQRHRQIADTMRAVRNLLRIDEGLS